MSTHLAAGGLEFGSVIALEPVGSGRFARVWIASKSSPAYEGGSVDVAAAADAAADAVAANMSSTKNVGSGLAESTPVACKVFRAVGHSMESYQYELKVLKRIGDLADAREYVTTLYEAGVYFQLNPEPRVHCWFTMPLESYSMADALDFNMRQYECALPIDVVRCITLSLMRALAYIHSVGIIHCDIKPDNLLLPYGVDIDSPTEELRVKLADFGSAEFVESPTDGSHGTVGYIPPELMASGAKYDTSADIWSAGAVVYELLTGEYLVKTSIKPTNYTLVFEDDVPKEESAQAAACVDASSPNTIVDTFDKRSTTSTEGSEHSDRSTGDDDDEEDAHIRNAMYNCERIFGKPPQVTREMFEFYEQDGSIRDATYPVERVTVADLLAVRNGVVDPTGGDAVAKIASFIVECMRYKPTDRPTAIAAQGMF